MARRTWSVGPAIPLDLGVLSAIVVRIERYVFTPTPDEAREEQDERPHPSSAKPPTSHQSSTAPTKSPTDIWNGDTSKERPRSS
jgi:cytoskeletal protein RodZ